MQTYAVWQFGTGMTNYRNGPQRTATHDIIQLQGIIKNKKKKRID